MGMSPGELNPMMHFHAKQIDRYFAEAFKKTAKSRINIIKPVESSTGCCNN